MISHITTRNQRVYYCNTINQVNWQSLKPDQIIFRFLKLISVSLLANVTETVKINCSKNMHNYSRNQFLYVFKTKCETKMLFFKERVVLIKSDLGEQCHWQNWNKDDFEAKSWIPWFILKCESSDGRKRIAAWSRNIEYLTSGMVTTQAQSANYYLRASNTRKALGFTEQHHVEVFRASKRWLESYVAGMLSSTGLWWQHLVSPGYRVQMEGETFRACPWIWTLWHLYNRPRSFTDWKFEEKIKSLLLAKLLKMLLLVVTNF